MSLANKKLTPIPVKDGSGKFWEIKKQYKGIKQIVRRFKVEGGKFNIGDNVDTYVFDDYGTLDGFTAAPAEYARAVPEGERFANCYLEIQTQDKGQGDGAESIVTKVYQEAYDTLVEVEKPQEVTDENGRTTLRRTYIILNNAPEANSEFNPSSTLTPDVDNPDLYVFKQDKTIGNATTVVQRDFLEVTATPTQVGRDSVSWTENGLKVVEQNFIVQRGYDLSTFGTIGNTLGASGEITDLYLSALGNTTNNETASIFVARWSEPGILNVRIDRASPRQRVTVQAIGLDWDAISPIITEVTDDHRLIEDGIGNYEGFQTHDYTFEVTGSQEITIGENGLRGLRTFEFSETAFTEADTGTVGTTTLAHQFTSEALLTLTLSSVQVNNLAPLKTRTRTWAEPGILNVQTPLVGGEQRVVVSCIAMSSAAVTSELAKVTANHKLIDEGTGNYEGFQTKNYVFEVDDFEVLSATENGLSQLTRTQLATISFTSGDVGTDTYLTLILAGEEIDNGNTIKRRESRWAEAGTLSVSTRLVNDGVKQTTYTYLGVEGVPTGTIIARRIGSHDGFRTFEIDVLTGKDGATLTGDAGAAKLNHQYQQLVPFTFPGVVDLVQEQNHIFPSIRSPVEALVRADVLIYYQSSADIESSDFTLDSAIGIWNPSEWCQKISTIDSYLNDNGNIQPAYYNAQGIRGARTREAFEFFNLDAEIDTYSGLQELAILNLEESTTLVNGRSTYTKTIKYVHDITRQVRFQGGVRVDYASRAVTGKYAVTCQWTGSAWEVTYSDVIVDRTPTDASGNGLYTYSARAGEWSDTYTNSSASTSGTLATSTSGGETPDLATWTAPVVVGAPSREETVSGGSLPENVGFGIPAAGFWIEGRQVDNGAFGRISIEGGPPNPFGKRYVLDVNIKKAFDDVDGNTTWMKQVVIADVTPVL